MAAAAVSFTNWAPLTSTVYSVTSGSKSKPVTAGVRISRDASLVSLSEEAVRSMTTGSVSAPVTVKVPVFVRNPGLLTVYPKDWAPPSALVWRVQI